jgi:hypothetical protein
MTALLLLLAQSYTYAQGAGAALQFDGVDDYVSVAHDSSLNLTGDYAIELFLKPEVTFDASATSYQGILDKGDYQMYLDPDDGKLKFVQPMGGAFSGEFDSNLDAEVRALVEYNGELYIGGMFTTAGGVEVNHIARFNGSTWNAVGTGVSGGDVLALAVHNGELYVGGDFTYAGGIEANNIAKWNGSNWSAVGDGFDGAVKALGVYDGELYAGGEFTHSGVTAVNLVARWDGNAWNDVGGGLTGSGWDPGVFALREYNGELYAGGIFDTAGGGSADCIARWNGSLWTDVGGGVASAEDAAVYALEVFDGDLIVGGEFDTAGGISAPLMARWDGGTWHEMGTVAEGMWGFVLSLTVYDGRLYAAGEIWAPSPTYSYVMEWDGIAWRRIGEVYGWVYALGVYYSGVGPYWLYAGGEFDSVGGEPAKSLARWNSSDQWWERVGPALGSVREGEVFALTVYQDELYAGGWFGVYTPDGWAERIAKWDGTGWHTLVDPGMNHDVYTLVVYDDDLYAGGWFSSAGGVPAEHVAKWDGITWSALGAGTDSLVNVLEGYNGELYAGGWFTEAGGQPAQRIARWNGTSWNALGAGTDGGVLALTVYNGELYVGGHFSEAGGMPAGYIARWNGVDWVPMTDGMDDDVLALAIYDHNLYAGGAFEHAGDEQVNYIACWDGVAWSPVGTGMSGPVRALTVYNNELYAGGDFYVAGLQVTPYIARWNGNTWSPVDVGTDQPVNALAVWDDQQAGGLFVGGSFHRAGDCTSPYFARWTQPLRSIASSRTTWPPVQHHVAVTCDSSDIAMYVNGVLESTEATLAGEVDTTTTPLWIGRSSGPPIDGGTGEFFAGQIDEVRIADEWLSESDIRDTLNTKLTGEVSVTAYYRFDEGSGEVTTDSSPNNNAGSLVGPSWVTSTAPLGDASTWTDTGSSLSLSSSYGDWLELVDLTGAPPFAALMRVDEAPNTTDVGSGLFQVFDSHYFEAWIPEGSAPTYAAVYHYTGHPGVTQEDVLALAFRSNANVPVWDDSAALLDTMDDTLRVDGETGGQYILGEAGYELIMAVDPLGAGTTLPSDGSQTKHLVGSTVEIRATPNPGYVFDHWESSFGDDPVPDPGCPTEATVLMDADKVVTAHFITGESIDSSWVGGTECSGFPGEECWNIAENWCPQIVPNNETGRQFSVGVPGPPTTITLDSSPTIDTLWINEDMNVEVSDVSGADVRTLVAVDGILNQGLFRATDRERLVLDAPVIDQAEVLCEGGVLEASDGVAQPGEESAKSILTISGAQVLGGTVRTIGDHSEIHLIGGAELHDTCIEGVVVPDGQIGSFSGMIENTGTFGVAPGGSEDSWLVPGATGGVLSGNGGDDDRVRLGGEFVALLGDFDSSFTNAGNHTIDGAGIIFGGVTNDGVIEANNFAAERLIISAPGPKVNNGLFRASGGGTLQIESIVEGNGSYIADGGTVTLAPYGGAASIAGSSLDVFNGGVVNVREDAAITLSGQVLIGAAGTYQADPEATGEVSTALTAGSLTIMEGPPGGQPGAMLLTDSMSVVLGGDLTMDGTNAGSCQSSRSDTPPILRAPAETSVSVAQIEFLNSVDVLVAEAAVVEVCGSFVNHSVYPECFDCLGGAIVMAGSATQDFELAGEDRGADMSGFNDNFAVGTLELGPGVEVNMVDTFDNQQDGQADCDEVLYVGTLILNPGTVLNTNGCTVYYESLIDNGGVIPGLGVDVLSVATADFDGDGDVDLDDFAALYNCMTAPPPSQTCLDKFDVDGDSDIDLKDFAYFQRRFGAGA